MPKLVTLPNGKQITVPDNATQSEVIELAMRQGLAKHNEWGQWNGLVAELGYTKTPATRSTPEIPDIESPTNVRDPFAQAPSEQPPTGGAVALGPQGPSVSELPSISEDGTTPSVSPEQKRNVLALGKGPISLESPEAQAAISPPPPPRPARLPGEVPIFTPGTEQFATKPLLPSQKPASIKMVELSENPIKVREALAQQDEKNKQASYYLTEYGSLDSNGLEKKKAQAQTEASAIDASSKGLELRWERLQQAQNELNSRKSYIDSITNRQEYENAVDKYNKDASAISAEYQNLQKLAESIKDLSGKLTTEAGYIAKREHDIKAQKGNMFAAYGYSFLNQVGKVTTGSAEFFEKYLVPDESKPFIEATNRSVILGLEKLGVFQEGAYEYAQRTGLFDWKNYLNQVEQNATKMTGIDKFVTPEFIEKKKEESLFNAGILATAEMLPGVLLSAATGGTGSTAVMGATFFASSYRDMGKEMQGEYWDQIPDAEKEAIRIGTSMVSAGLGTIGLQGLAGKIPVINQIFFNAAKRMLPGMTAGQVRRLIDAETKSYVANLLSKVSQGYVLESFEEALDYTQEELVKHFYEEYKRSQFGDKADTLFQNAESLDELASGVIENGAVGGVAGSLMGGVIASASSMNARKRISDREFSLFKSIVESGNVIQDFESNAAASLAAGRLDKAEYDKVVDDLKNAQIIASQIPDNLSVAATREAFDLLDEKSKLKKKDPALVSARIKEIDAKLAELSTKVKPKEEVAESVPAAKPTPAAAPAPALEPEVDEEFTIDDAKELVGKVVEYRGQEGYIDIDEGGKVTFTNVGGGKIYEIGTEEDMQALANVTEVPIENVVNEDGSITIGNKNFVADIGAAEITRDNEGGIYSIELETSDGVKTFFGDLAATIIYENQLRTVKQDENLLAQIETNITTDAEIKSLIEQERDKQKRRLARRKAGKGAKGPVAQREAQGPRVGDEKEQAAEVREEPKDWTKEEMDEFNALMEQEELDTIEQRMSDFVAKNKQHFSTTKGGVNTIRMKAPKAIKKAWADMQDTLEYKKLREAEQEQKPTADAVQERTTEEVGAQPVGTEGAGQEGRGGVGPSVQGPEAPQAGGPQGQVTPTAEGPVRPEAPAEPAPAAPAPAAAPAPNKKTVAKMKELAKAEDGIETNNTSRKNKSQKKIDALLESDARLKEVRDNFDKAVADLEKSGKLKVRCP